MSVRKPRAWRVALTTVALLVAPALPGWSQSGQDQATLEIYGLGHANASVDIEHNNPDGKVSGGSR